MAVTLTAEGLARYPRFSLHNSPYPAHDAGRAVDLYPAVALDGDPDRDPTDGGPAPSPVAGEVVDTRTVDAPSRPHAAAHDHLILVDTGAAPADAGGVASEGEYVARLLHVDPAVEPGDGVAVGDSLGRLVRSGFFAPWVDDHLHLGFRSTDANPYRASGSLPLELDPALDLRPLDWDGTGTVVRTGPTHAVLDAPAHPDPGACFVGVDGGGVVLDGGCPHYEGGGALGGADGTGRPDGPVSLAGRRVGTAAGRAVTWDDLTVLANGDPVTGVSLFCGRDADWGVKLVCPDRRFAVGDEVTVAVERAE